MILGRSFANAQARPVRFVYSHISLAFIAKQVIFGQIVIVLCTIEKVKARVEAKLYLHITLTLCFS